MTRTPQPVRVSDRVIYSQINPLFFLLPPFFVKSKYQHSQGPLISFLFFTSVIKHLWSTWRKSNCNKRKLNHRCYCRPVLFYFKMSSPACSSPLPALRHAFWEITSWCYSFFKQRRVGLQMSELHEIKCSRCSDESLHCSSHRLFLSKSSSPFNPLPH